MLWTVLAWARREIETFVTASPAPRCRPAPAIATLVTSPNLLVNPGAELGDPSLSGYSSVTAAWLDRDGTPTVIEYGTQRRFPFPTRVAGADTARRSWDFRRRTAHRPTAAHSSSAADRRHVHAQPNRRPQPPRRPQSTPAQCRTTLSGDLGGFFIDPSAASVTVTFLDASRV